MKGSKARIVGVKDLKARATELVREMEETREPVVITRRGKAVARLLPMEEEERVWADSLTILREMDALAEEIEKHVPPGTSAVDAVREQRGDL